MYGGFKVLIFADVLEKFLCFFFCVLVKRVTIKFPTDQKQVEHFQWFQFIGFETISGQRTLTVDDMSEKSL